MTPCELNVVIMALTNYFYTTLSQEDFVCLSIILRELSKTMISTTIFQDICPSCPKCPDRPDCPNKDK